MRFLQDLVSTQFFLENLGYCRLSAFYSDANHERGILVEMVGRLAVAILAAVSCYDLATKNLPFAAKIIVQGTLLTIITSFCLSLVLRVLLPKSEKEFQSPGKDDTGNNAVIGQTGTIVTPETKETSDQASSVREKNLVAQKVATEADVYLTPTKPVIPSPVYRLPPSPGPEDYPDIEEVPGSAITSTKRRVARRLFFD